MSFLDKGLCETVPGPDVIEAEPAFNAETAVTDGILGLAWYTDYSAAADAQRETAAAAAVGTDGVYFAGGRKRLGLDR